MTCKSLLMVEIRVPNYGTPRIDFGIFLMIMKIMELHKNFS